MKRYHEGEKSKGICEKCREIVTTTFRYADLPYDGHLTAPPPSGGGGSQ